MSTFCLSSRQGTVVVPLDQAEGKPLKAVHVYLVDDALNLDLQFQDDTSIELIFRADYRASATLLAFENGNSRVIRKLKPKKFK